MPFLRVRVCAMSPVWMCVKQERIDQTEIGIEGYSDVGNIQWHCRIPEERQKQPSQAMAMAQGTQSIWI